MLKKRITGVIIAGALVGLPATLIAANKPKSDQEKISYSLGYMAATMLKKQHIPVTYPSYTAGLKAGLQSAKPAMSKEEMTSALRAFQQKMLGQIKQENDTVAASNLKEANAFLAENKVKPGVVTLPSGVQYKVMTAGSGKSPMGSNKVTVNYEGKLLDGKVFDSSYQRKQSVTFPVNGVIQGWQDALVHMKPGATWMVYIPPHLAYGEAGVPAGGIGPNAMLIFKINLISVAK